MEKRGDPWVAIVGERETLVGFLEGDVQSFPDGSVLLVIGDEPTTVTPLVWKDNDFHDVVDAGAEIYKEAARQVLVEVARVMQKAPVAEDVRLLRAVAEYSELPSPAAGERSETENPGVWRFDAEAFEKALEAKLKELGVMEGGTRGADADSDIVD